MKIIRQRRWIKTRKHHLQKQNQDTSLTRKKKVKRNLKDKVTSRKKKIKKNNIETEINRKYINIQFSLLSCNIIPLE